MESKNISNKVRLLTFYGMAVLFLIIGITQCGSFEAFKEGYKTILTAPSLIDFDGLKQAGQFGSAYINAFILLSIAMTLYAITGTEISGGTIAAAMMVTGFSFYGKNVLNIWPTIIGVLGYTAFKKKPLNTATGLACFSTALSPVFSVLAFGTERLGPGSPTAIAVGVIFGVIAGVLIGVLGGFLPKRHEGFVLYNAGFAAGLAGTLINSLLIAIGLGHERIAYAASDYVSGSNAILASFLAITFVYLFIVGVLLGGGKSFGKLLTHRSKGGDYVKEFGFGAALMNMGVIGALATVYVFLTGLGQLAGPVFGCIYTAAGFATNGVTILTYLPSMIGVYGMCFLTGGVSGAMAGNEFLASAIAKVSTRPMLLAAIFSCGIAPISGAFGFGAGILIGAIHSVLVPNTGVLHGWMSLYNNGYSLSLLATFLYPIYSWFGGKKAEG